ncbi:hypothetical protein HHI36_002862 [Cryptolaemus montrouzieri]|uniref:MAT1 C-terminal CAK anchor domain-containing protein n=1 Tax=Cryptolaemus montrouzieri TaxID=559131 RepID=A0ABD2PC96_9CUCU
MFSDSNAKNILETFAEKAKEEEVKAPPPKMTQFSSGIQFGRQTQLSFLPIPTDEGVSYSYKPVIFEASGPTPPSEYDIIVKGYTKNVRAETEQERAGGFQSSISCMRALQDALTGLYHTKKQTVN